MRDLLQRDTAEAYAAFRRLAPEHVTVDGRRVACLRAGHGAPSIVFLAGAGMAMDSWFRVLHAAGTLGTAVAPDRPGVGGSERAVAPQDGLEVVGWVRRVVEALGLPPPHVVVGHSVGGLIAQLWARTHPGEIAGMVLVESASAAEAAAAAEAGPGPRGSGLARVARGVLARLRPGRPGGSDEADRVPETARQLAGAGPFPPIRVVVVTGGSRMRGVPEDAFAAHLAAQATLPGLSPLGRQVIAPGSGHFPQLTEPDLVLDAIRSVAAEALRDAAPTT